MDRGARELGRSAEAAQARVEGAAKRGEAAVQDGAIDGPWPSGLDCHLLPKLLGDVARGIRDLAAIGGPGRGDLVSMEAKPG